MNCYGVDSIHQRERLPATYFGSHHQQPSNQPTQEVSKDQTWAIDCEISAAFGWSHFDHLTVFLFGSHLVFFVFGIWSWCLRNICFWSLVLGLRSLVFGLTIWQRWPLGIEEEPSGHQDSESAAREG